MHHIRTNPAQAAPDVQDDGPVLAAWHVAWAAAVAALALGALWVGDAERPLLYAALAAVAPGVLGLGLLYRDHQPARAALMALWTVSAVVAAGLSGGVSGPLAGFVFMPLAAAIALGGFRSVSFGAMAVGTAVLSGLFSNWLSGTSGGSHPTLAATAALISAVAAALAVRLAFRRAERRIAAAEVRLTEAELLLTGQPSLSLVLDEQDRVAAAYGKAPAQLSSDVLIGEGLMASVHAADRPHLVAALSRARAGKEASVVLSPRIALDRRFQLLLRRIENDPHGRVVAQAFDATDQYARELALESARAEAEAREAGKTRFLANMSHELRTPLNAVLGFSDIMRQRLFGPIPDRYADYAGNIHEAGGHLLDLINDLLDVSKIEAERYTLTRERFDVREVASAAIALVRVNASDKGVAVSGVLPPEPVEVSADRRAMKQIALNLLSNAVKFTPAGGAVTVTIETAGPDLELTVADTGVGIAPEDVKRLGKPFEQAGGLEQRRLGTGLGLSLVRAFAELHGGGMTIESTLGEGTAVTVRMPIALVARAPAPEGGAEIIPLPLANGG